MQKEDEAGKTKGLVQKNYTRILEEKRKNKVVEKLDEPHKPKTDTIVAIGYADRQRKQTLEMVGKVKTEL